MSRTFTMNCEGGDVTVTIVEFLQLTGSSPDGRHRYSGIVSMTDADEPVIQIIGEHTSERQALLYAAKWAKRLSRQLKTGKPLKFPPVVETPPEHRKGIADAFMAECARMQFEAVEALMASADMTTAH